MHDPGPTGGLSVEFWRDRTFVEMTIGYQITQAVLDNIDSFAKNHFLYHDLEQDRWGHITWDLDLTFGKFFTPTAVFRSSRGHAERHHALRASIGSATAR
jgi:spore coat protein CotH